MGMILIQFQSCSELVTHSYKRSFFTDIDGLPIIPISTARAGNVIGGGDFASDRIIPDCIRAAVKHEDIVVRNPYSTRPYQHVLEPLYAYLLIAMKQYEDIGFADYYNVGPDDVDCFQTGALVELFVNKWGEGMRWVNKYDGGPHEANFLKLDCSKLKKTFGWSPRWNLDEAMEKIVEWSKVWLAGGDVRVCMDKQIDEFLTYNDNMKNVIVTGGNGFIGSSLIKKLIEKGTRVVAVDITFHAIVCLIQILLRG